MQRLAYVVRMNDDDPRAVCAAAGMGVESGVSEEAPFRCVPSTPPTEPAMSDAPSVINATTLGCSITCKDLEASIRFYRDAIGFALLQSYEHNGKVAAAVVGAGNCQLVLNQDDGKLGWDRIKGQGFYLQINVAAPADVDAAAARITTAGGALIDEPADRNWGVRMFQFNDLDGFKLGVSTPLAG